jgi:hypothetical protein
MTNKISSKDGVKTLVYGPSGIGKTRLALTAPRPFVASAEKGLLSLRKESIPYVDISDYKSLTDFFEWFARSNDTRYIDTLFLDSLTEIAQVILSEEKRQNKDARQAYMKMQDSVYDLIRHFRDIKQKNIVLLAWESQVDIGLTKKSSPVIPSEKLLTSLPYFWDVVLHMHWGRTPDGVLYKAFHTQDSDQWVAKDRSGRLDPLEECNLSKLFAKASS